MIARIWHGWARGQNADRYEELLREEVLPGIHTIEGYLGGYLLRREGEEVEFVTVTLWDSLEAVRAFAGPDHEAVVVPPEAQALLDRFDERSAHYEVRARPEEP